MAANRILLEARQRAEVTIKMVLARERGNVSIGWMGPIDVGIKEQNDVDHRF